MTSEETRMLQGFDRISGVPVDDADCILAAMCRKNPSVVLNPEDAMRLRLMHARALLLISIRHSSWDKELKAIKANEEILRGIARDLKCALADIPARVCKLQTRLKDLERMTS